MFLNHSCHNQIVSWEKTSSVQPILLQGTDDYIKTKDRWNIIEEYLESKNIDYKSILSIEGNILSKVMNLIYFLDYVSMYHAVLNEKDPSPVDSINFVEKRL